MNGQLMERTQAKIDIEDRGYQFGDGVYEVIRVYNGHMFTAEEHLSRLMESASKIRLTVPYAVSSLMGMLESLIQENNLQMGIVYLQLTRGTSPRNHVFPSNEVEPVFVAYTKEVKRPEDLLEKGIKTITVEDIRWLKCDIKSLNLLANLLAKQSAADQGCFEAIQHRNGTVTEGSSSNISIVIGGKVVTHPANNLILNGIVRQVMLKICRENGIEVIERPFTVEELLNADEVIMSSTTAEIMPIVEVDGQRIGDGEAGNVTKQLQALYQEAIEKKCRLPFFH